MSSKTKDLRSADPTYIDEVLTKQIAAIMVSGASVADCAKQLAISPAAVRKITSSDSYKTLMAQAADEELGPALAKAKAQLAKLSGKAVLAIERALDEGGHREALQAAGIVLKAVGLAEDEQKQQETQIIVQLPNGITNVEAIEVKDAADD